MGRKCCAYGCKSGYDSQKGKSVDQVITMHCYPIKNKELCDKWIHANPRKDFKPTENSGLCSLHFTENDFVLFSQDKDSRRRKYNKERALCNRYLKKDAVPSVFENPAARVFRKTNPSTSATSKAGSERERKQPSIFEPSFAVDNPVINDSSSETHDEIINETLTPREFHITSLKDGNGDIPDLHLTTTVWGEHFMSIAESLVKYRKHGFLCDTVMVARCGRELKAHSALLAAVSPVFLTTIQEKSSSGQYHLCFPVVEFEVLEIAVHFIYTGKLLLPTVYSQVDQLSALFNELSELGLNRQKLLECEMTFVGSAKLPSNLSNSVNVEDTVKTPSPEDSIHQLHPSCEWPVDIKPSSAEAFNEVLIIDNAPHVTRRSQMKGDTEKNSQSTLAVQKAEGNRGQVKQQKRKHLKTGNQSSRTERMPSSSMALTDTVMKTLALGLLKTDLNTTATALHSSGNGSRELNSLPMIGLLLEQNIEKVNTLNSDSSGISESIDSDNGETKSKPKGAILDVAGGPATKGISGPNDNAKQMARTSTISFPAYMHERYKEPNTETFPNEIKVLWHKMKHHWDQYNECNHCGQRLTSRSSLMNHMKRHLGINPQPKKNHKCNNCGMHFMTPFQLRNHMVRHTGEKPHECPECRKHFTLRENMQRHRLLHTGNYPFLCDFCGKGFTRKMTLRDHVTQYHEYECALCSCKQTSKTDMEKHALEVHQLTQVVSFNSIIKTPMTYLCDVCGKNCYSVSRLRCHLITHRKKLFICDVCQKSFSSKFNLKKHMLEHSKKKQFTCEFCSKQFTTKQSLIVHHRIHTGERPFNCTFCSKRFCEKSSLTVHVRMHTGDKPFSCTLCKMSFAQSQHLIRHMRTHTGEKPFVCRICGKSYKHKIDLRYHYTRFHKIDNTLTSLSENFEINEKCRLPEASDRLASVCTVDEL